MQLKILIENLINLEKEGRAQGISKEDLEKLEIVETDISVGSERTIISRSIKLDLAEDEKGNIFILKSDYNTHYDNVMRNLGK